MKTAEDFLKEQEIHQVHIGGIVYEMVKLSQAIKASEKYAQEVVNNLDKADVIKYDCDERKALLIDFICWYLNVFMRDKKLTKTKTPIQSIDIFLNSI